MGSLRAALVVVLAALFLAAGAPASSTAVPPGWKLIDAHIVKSTYPIALTSAYPLNHPNRVAVRLIGPKGKVLRVSWSAYCKKGVTSEMNHGVKKGTGTAMVEMRFPFAHPDSCTVSGGGSLDKLPVATGKPPTFRLQIQLLTR